MLNYEIKDKQGNVVALATTYTEALETADAITRARQQTVDVVFNEAVVYSTTTAQTLFG